MRHLLLILCSAFALAPDFVSAQNPEQQVVVEDPFIELHTGPGSGYPVFYVVERRERVTILLRRTDWFKVRAPRGQEGWVNSDQLQETLQLTGEPVEVPRFGLEDYRNRRWEIGALYGDFDGANVISAFGAYRFTEHLSGEFWFSDVLGRFSNSQLLNLNIVHTLFPEWRVTPYFTLGGGVIKTEPKGTIVATTDRTDDVVHAGVGVRTYLARRFVLRAEYKSYVVLTSRDNNEEPSEWKVGFSFFF